MATQVKLSEIIFGLESQFQKSSAYVKKKTGEVAIITDEEFFEAEKGDSLENYPEWQQGIIKIARDILEDDEKYISLPSKFDIDEYRMMERFCLSIKDKEISDSLYNAIKGTGAFRGFKDGVHRFGVADDWYKYRDQELKRIAISWCEENKIEYIDDLENYQK